MVITLLHNFYSFEFVSFFTGTITRDAPMTNIRREPCGGWMIVLFMVVSFIVIRCVDGMCQSLLSECVFFLIIVFGLVVMDFLPFLAFGR